jgi:hypothetical protein
VRRLFPLALLLLACPSKKDKVGDPLDASVMLGAAADGWVLTPAKLEAYLRYQKATLVHLGLVEPAAFDGGPLKSFEDKPEAHADFDEWLRKSNGLSEDDVKRLDQMAGPIAMMTLLQMTPSQESAKQQAIDLAAIAPDKRPEAVVKNNDGKVQLDDLNKRFGEGNIRVMLSRQDDVAKNWLKLAEVKDGAGN